MNAFLTQTWPRGISCQAVSIPLAIIDDVPYDVRSLSIMGVVVGSTTAWAEDGQQIRIEVEHRGIRYVLHRRVRWRWVNEARGETGFDFVATSPEHNDIVLGLVIAQETDAHLPVVACNVNRTAIARLAMGMPTACPKGAWEGAVIG